MNNNETNKTQKHTIKYQSLILKHSITLYAHCVDDILSVMKRMKEHFHFHSKKVSILI